MPAAKATARGTIDDKIAIANLQDIRRCAATRTLSAAVPAPAVLGDEASAACAESVVLAVALGDGRGVLRGYIVSWLTGFENS